MSWSLLHCCPPFPFPCPFPFLSLSLFCSPIQRPSTIHHPPSTLHPPPYTLIRILPFPLLHHHSFSILHPPSSIGSSIVQQHHSTAASQQRYTAEALQSYHPPKYPNLALHSSPQPQSPSGQLIYPRKSPSQPKSKSKIFQNPHSPFTIHPTIQPDYPLASFTSPSMLAINRLLLSHHLAWPHCSPSSPTAVRTTPTSPRSQPISSSQQQSSCPPLPAQARRRRRSRRCRRRNTSVSSAIERSVGVNIAVDTRDRVGSIRSPIHERGVALSAGSNVG